MKRTIPYIGPPIPDGKWITVQCDCCEEEFVLYMAHRTPRSMGRRRRPIVEPRPPDVEPEEVEPEEKAEIPRHETRRQRAIRHGIEWDTSVTLRGVLERDGNVCALCGGKMSKAVWGVYSGEVASLDHIIPVSKGGSHIWGNVQAVHHLCNAQKGVKVA